MNNSESFNEEQVDGKWVVGSLDVDSLYPSLDVDRCVEVVKRKLYESDLVFENLRWKEVVLYLRYQLTDGEIGANGFAPFIPTRRFNRRPPLFTRSGSNTNEKIRCSPWRYPSLPPGADMLRKMFCKAISVMVKRTMMLHDFQIDGVLYRQKEGGAIGMDLTGVVSDIYMVEWDKELINGMEAEAISAKLYKRYKDDVNLVLNVGDEGLAGDQRGVMEKVKGIADVIDPNLKVTTDNAGNHEDGRLPILDLNVWIGKSKGGEIKILHSHYMKEVASRMTIHHRSSHSQRMKESVMLNEVSRILDNCSEDLPWQGSQWLTMFDFPDISL